ncbi:hypothetical protein [Vogesella sp. XCS3]|uniref:hypothetical protein n=1 Tax=Vogesella sp. XCS3 TaxID=2877939 RepID=UPI001D0BA1B9|nr:hypothetical protein [Vogesella sp. XCS3]UDM18868.1 hypothetical protein LCH97_18535 [Vogesella sp. XCS3]
MAKLTQELIDLITEQVGRFNTDVLTGWETGLQGKQRIGSRLYERHAPAHLEGQRYADWLAGKVAAQRYKDSIRRETHFAGHGPNGAMLVVRKGWVARGKVITQMEKAGACGDVLVFYMENGKIKRTERCGI